jgi:hypothetical protein
VARTRRSSNAIAPRRTSLSFCFSGNAVREQRIA